MSTTQGFDFYIRFAIPLVLNLTDPNDRVLAAAWIQKLRALSSAPEKLRTDYIKLFIFVLQRGRLWGPFVNNPSEYEELEPLGDTSSLKQIARSWLEAEENENKKRLWQILGAHDFPPLKTECSGDLLEYASTQNIPKFGVHAYYALSNEPIPHWDNIAEEFFSREIWSAISGCVKPTQSSNSMSRMSSSRSRSRSRSRSKRSEDAFSSSAKSSLPDDIRFENARKKSSQRWPQETKEDRKPPCWGSNLISVGDPPVHEDYSSDT